MKRSLLIGLSGPAASVKSVAAFTLVEMMTTMAVFALLVAGYVSFQLFGSHSFIIARTKLAATDYSRKALNQVRDEIRSAKLLYVGNGNASSFSLLAGNAPRMGNALQIFPTADTNTFTYYFLDTNSCCLNRMTSGGSNVAVIGQYITNAIVFQAQDFQGNVLTNDSNNRAIQISLQFYQCEYPVGQAGADCLSYYFQVQTCIARRLIE
jgi:prepilin-type N-terminal cleavage/methylation domain-containing protein